MSSIADAYVELHVDGDSIEGEVKSSVKSAERGTQKEFDKAGASLGQHMGDGFFKGFNLKNRRLTKNGSVVGAAFASSFAKGLSSGMTAATGVMQGFAKSVKGVNLQQLKMVGIGGLIAVVPLLTSSIGALSGSLVSLVGASAQAGYASFALLGILGTMKQVTFAVKLGMDGMSEAMKGTEGAMAKLAPSAQKVVKQLNVMKPAWADLKKSIQGELFRGVARELNTLGNSYIPILKTNLTQTGAIANGVLRDLMKWAQLPGTQERIGAALKGNNAIFKTLGSAARPILNGILRVYVALLPAAQQLAERVAENARQFARFTRSGSNMDALFDKFVQGRIAVLRLWRIVRNLGGVLKNVFGAATPAGNGLLKTFVQLTGRLKRFTDLASTKNSIASFMERANKVSGALFRGLGKIGKALAPLFDPSIVLKFMDMFKSIQPTLGSIFGKIVPIVQAVFGNILEFVTPIFDKIGAAVKENGPKFEAFFGAVAPLISALAPLFKGIGSVIGEVIGQTIGFLGGIASALAPVIKFITPIVAAVAGFIGGVLTKFAPIIATVILAFVNWGSVAGKVIMGFIRFIPVIGRFIAPLIKLASWLISKIAPAFRFLGKIVGVVFRGIGKVIATIAKAVWGVITRVFGGIGKFIGGALGAAGRVVATVFNTMKSVAGRVIGAIYNTVKSGFTRVLNFFKSIPDKIMNLAGAFLSTGTDLGKKVISGIMDGLRAAGGFVSDLMGSIKGAINSALNLPFTIKGPGPLPDMTIPAFARGTNYAPGGAALVGERGPEIVNLPRGSKVKTARETRGLLGGRAGHTFIINNPVPERASQSVQKVLSQKSYEAGWAG